MKKLQDINDSSNIVSMLRCEKDFHKFSKNCRFWYPKSNSINNYLYILSYKLIILMYVFLNLIMSENGGIENIMDLNMFGTLLC